MIKFCSDCSEKLTPVTRVKSCLTFIREARRNANDSAYNEREQILQREYEVLFSTL